MTRGLLMAVLCCVLNAPEKREERVPPPGTQPNSTAADLVIRNGRIVDGSGNPWFYGDVAIRDGRIVAVGDVGDLTARREIDADGLVVAPGFIDVHTHADDGPLQAPAGRELRPRRRDDDRHRQLRRRRARRRRVLRAGCAERRARSTSPRSSATTRSSAPSRATRPAS